ncbi:MAG: DUF5333 domain-containing protein [Pseudomonadota bacterium]
MFRKTLGAVCLCLVTLANPASADTGLSQEADINKGLVIIAAADKIRRSCDTIGGRLFRAQRYANSLKAVARSRGYSDQQIDAFLDSKAERAKVREKRNVYFQNQGASNLDHASLCVLGYAEIARNSQIGYLLKAR